MTRIVADTLCGLAPDLARELGIPLIPQIINFGEDSFREGVEMDNAAFMARLLAGRELPKTAAPYPGDFIAAFADLTQTNDSIVCIHPSAEVSGTVRSALTGREAFPQADIHVIDTRTIAGPLASIVLQASRLARSGANAAEVESAVIAMSRRARIFFLVDTLDYLRRGGRIGNAAALVGSILQVKPILTFANGRVAQFEKERTKKRALARLKELVVAEAAHGDEAHLTVMHAAAPTEAAELAAELSASLGVAAPAIMDLVPAIVTHAGPGTLAVGFFVP